MNKIYFKSTFNSILIDNLGIKINSEKIGWNKINSIKIHIVPQAYISGVYFTLTLKSGVKFLTDSISVKLVDYVWIRKHDEEKILEFAYELKEYYSYQDSVHRMSIKHLSKDLPRFRKSKNGFIKLIVFSILFIVIHKLTMSSLASFEDYAKKHDFNSSNMAYSNGNLCSGHVRLTRKVDETLIYERYCGFMDEWYRYDQEIVKIPKPDKRKDKIRLFSQRIVVINNIEYQAQPSKSKLNWYDAKESCYNLNLQGQGWRLPTLNELEKMSNIYLCDNLFERPCIISRNRWLDLNDEHRVKLVNNGVGVFIKKELPYLHENFLHRFWTSEYAQSNWSTPLHRDATENFMYIVDFLLAQVKIVNKNENHSNSVICVRDDLSKIIF